MLNFVSVSAISVARQFKLLCQMPGFKIVDNRSDHPLV